MAQPAPAAAAAAQAMAHEHKKTAEEEDVVVEKHLVDEVSGWLRLYSDGSVDRTWTGAPELQFLASPYFPSPSDAAADGVSLHDLTIDPSADLAVRVYLPSTFAGEGDGGERRRFPVFLHFHGGGFCISRPSWYMYYHFYARLARETGAAVVSVYTRPAPEHRLPAAVDDCFAALLWLRFLARSGAVAPADDEHPAVTALRRAADFSRVFLVGDSSGANLVHEVAARAGREGDGFWKPLRVAGAVPIHAGFVRSTRSESESRREFEGAFLTVEMIDKLLALALPEGATKDHPITCPMGTAAPPMEGLRVPPMLVPVAERDLMRDTQMEYCQAMQAAGKDVEVVVSHGVGHCFYFDKIRVDGDAHVEEQTAALIAAIKGFMDRH